MQVRGLVFDVEVLVLSSAALRSEYTAAVDLLEIPLGETHSVPWYVLNVRD